MNPVDKRRVRAAFSRSASLYDVRAVVQRDVRARVLELLRDVAPEARRILDVGSGTGALLARIAGERPGVATAAIDLAPGMCAATRRATGSAIVAAADAEALPFRQSSFDLVVSTSTLQWLPRLDRGLAEMRRVLAPGGTLCVALFGARTLHELRSSWRAVRPAADLARTHRFHTRADLEAALRTARLDVATLVEEELVELHPDARAVLRALKDVGASSAVPERSRRGLGGRGATLEMLRRYEERHLGPSGVPATYHVLTAVARRPVEERGSALRAAGHG